MARRRTSLLANPLDAMPTGARRRYLRATTRMRRGAPGRAGKAAGRRGFGKAVARKTRAMGGALNFALSGRQSSAGTAGRRVKASGIRITGQRRAVDPTSMFKGDARSLQRAGRFTAPGRTAAFTMMRRRSVGLGGRAG